MLKETQHFLPLGSEKAPMDCQPRIQPSISLGSDTDKAESRLLWSTWIRIIQTLELSMLNRSPR